MVILERDIFGFLNGTTLISRMTSLLCRDNIIHEIRDNITLAFILKHMDYSK